MFNAVCIFGLGYFLGHNNFKPNNIFSKDFNKQYNLDNGLDIMGVPVIAYEKNDQGKVPSFIIMNTLKISMVEDNSNSNDN